MKVQENFEGRAGRELYGFVNMKKRAKKVVHLHMFVFVKWRNVFDIKGRSENCQNSLTMKKNEIRCSK